MSTPKPWAAVTDMCARELAGTMKKMVADWETGGSCSPDTRDYLYAADDILRKAYPGFGPRQSHLVFQAENQLTDSAYELDCDGVDVLALARHMIDEMLKAAKVA